MALGRLWWFRRLWRAAGLVLIAGLAGAFFASPAAACTDPNHCYAVAKWDLVRFVGPTYTGALAYIKTEHLVTPTPSSDLATNQLWVGTNGAFGTFVETGVIHGAVLNPDESRTDIRWFWGEKYGPAPNEYLFHSRNLPGFAYNATYAAKISFSGNGYFGVYRDGAFLANSTPNHYPPVSTMDAGTEHTSNGISSGSASCLQKRHSDNTSWSYTWNDNTTGAEILETHPPATDAGWIQQYRSLWYKYGNVAQTPAGCAGPPTSVPDFTFPAVADTYVDQQQPLRNYGSATEIRIKSALLPNSGDAGSLSPSRQLYDPDIRVRDGLLKFDTTDFESNHPIESVQLRLCALSSSVAGGDVWLAQGSPWDENSVNWASAPGLTGQPVANGPVVAGLATS